MVDADGKPVDLLALHAEYAIEGVKDIVLAAVDKVDFQKRGSN